MSRDHTRRPLIDNLHDYNLDVSDEEDAFYAQDEGDYLIHPKWRTIITKTSNRIPRRLQRYFVIYALAAIVFFVSWRVYIGPQIAAYKKEQADMDLAAQMVPVKSVPPGFTDLIQVKDLESEHLPKGKGRLVVVGDVHGCRKELEKLLEKVGFEQGADHLVLTGDIVAKGPDSPGVVDLASQLSASCVRGNHEDKVLLAIQQSTDFQDPSIPRPDVEVVNRSTDEEAEASSLGINDPTLLKLSKSFSKSQLAYLRSCPVILRVGKVGRLHNVAVVHAGLVPDVPLEDQDPFQVMNMRTIDLQTLLPSETRKYTMWEKYWNHQQKNKPEEERMTVIYGHDRKRGKNIKEFSMGLDSGCVSGGRLTAMVIEEDGKYDFKHVGCKGYV